ncbi:head-tail connector protein [Cypionkella sinensis]|uniref:Phage gp6-like head-tail connector protein n=1 Tax=Cypionkella sinensis TaxID=1756043 RepID=A0ABV7IU90_9RHOB
MMLTEITSVAAASLPVQALKDHLRLGSGFADDGMQDGLIESYLRAAMAAIEGRIGKVLLARRFQLTLQDWRARGEQPLPVAPVTALVSVTLVDVNAVSTVVGVDRYRLVQDTHRPKLIAAGVLLPTVPVDGRVEVVFDAGFGAAWGAVPVDLAQAVLLLAAEFYENRHDMGQRVAGVPLAVQALIERWRTVRVLGGGAA